MQKGLDLIYKFLIFAPIFHLKWGIIPEHSIFLYGIMHISEERKQDIIRELCAELNGRIDGGRKNIIVPVCPYCGKKGDKFGVCITDDKLFVTHCFKCGHTTTKFNDFLRDIGRMDLSVKETVELESEPEDLISFMDEDDEMDEELNEIEMPKGWKRTFKNKYLKSRGFIMEMYDMFPVGTTRGMNWKYDDYVIFQIIMNGKCVGFIGRNIQSKAYIEEHNAHSTFQIRRYLNSTKTDDENANDFSKLLFNYDSIVRGETETVILCEGIFNVMKLVKEFELYENHQIVPVATFGKKISQFQMYQIQKKGVTQVIVAYDMDAKAEISKTMKDLEPYFDVLALQLAVDDENKDIADCSWWELYDSFAYGLLDQVEFNLNEI